MFSQHEAVVPSLLLPPATLPDSTTGAIISTWAQTSVVVSQFSVALTDTKEQLIFQECPEILFRFVSQKKDFSCTPECTFYFLFSQQKCFVK